ncbi:unnamed protein product [Spirodela intermedia]|uniref:Receptor-like serine/threonine-protein kinase n=1 Tax=Spirodela intermedia TaxID=51605 RepID=A0A7I8IKI3_SPIIN|nr:unnamed protein product [Spirodela intermedia]CAA6658388.1 unnamed protein product [Spirodela intermedia]
MVKKPSGWLWLLSLQVPLLVLVFSGALETSTGSATSSISAGRPLAGDSTLVSHGGVFELGFFSPGKTGRFYAGIWYTKVSRRTPVWVANRAAPLRSAASELSISGDGNLVLLDEAKQPVWSTNATSISSNSTVAELLNTGNLILRDGLDSGNVFWQSFDHPTDSWLPGGKLGMNKLTGEVQRLVSWKNSEDPAPGIFSLEIDPSASSSQYFILWNSSHEFWSSGAWNGRIFSNVPEMVPGYIYDFAFVSGEEETYFTYNTTLSSDVISRFVVDISGQIKQLTWIAGAGEWMQFWSQPRPQCDVYRLCGPYGICSEKTMPHCACAMGFEKASPVDWELGDLTSGCARRTPLKCGGEDRFYTMPNVRLPAEPAAATARSAEECESACLGNCSCTGYSYDGGCSLRGTLHLRLAALEFPSPASGKKATVEIAVGTSAGAVAVVALALAMVWRWRQRKFRGLRLVEGSLVVFRYSELKRVTGNFSDKLGGGGFGSVYRGTMGDSTEVAVKKLEGLRQGEKEFRSEVCTIGTIQHVNLVRLRGSVRIARGGCWSTITCPEGLAYLHERCRDCIIHCDIKPENILLDGEFIPKVADFGMAKLVGREFSRVLTTVRGTRGYLAPEWMSGEAITAKADVYSFGMMLFEIISGRRNSEEKGEEKYAFFPAWAAKKLLSGELLGLVDPRMEEEADMEDLTRVLRVAFWCAQEDETLRPSMGHIIQILERAIDVEFPPIPRYLQLLWENPDAVEFSSTGVSSVQFSDVLAGGFSSSSQSTSHASSAANLRSFPSGDPSR